MFRHINVLARFGIGLIAAALFFAVSPVTLSAESPDALSRSEFDKEISLDVKDADITDIFRLFADVSHVPFVIEFDSDQSAKLTLKVTNITLSSILAMLASTNNLEYATTAEGIVVRRQGAPPSAKMAVLSAWPPEAGARHELRFEVRNAARGSQKTLMPNRIHTNVGIVSVLKWGIDSDTSVMVLDRRRSIGEREYVNGIELAICIKKDTDDRLDLLMELTSRRVLSATRYVETHEFATRNVSSADAPVVLFRTETGYEIILDSWRRLSEDNASDGETESDDSALLHVAS